MIRAWRRYYSYTDSSPRAVVRWREPWKRRLRRRRWCWLPTSHCTPRRHWRRFDSSSTGNSPTCFWATAAALSLPRKWWWIFQQRKKDFSSIWLRLPLSRLGRVDASITLLSLFLRFKGGKYKFIHSAFNSETQERMVVYQALYGDQAYWVRPEKMFFGKVTRDGRTFNRFTEIDK